MDLGLVTTLPPPGVSQVEGNSPALVRVGSTRDCHAGAGGRSHGA
jgi:hypothetical protein